MVRDEDRDIFPCTSYSQLGYRSTGCEDLLLSSCDPSKDCPVEILHTILLGVSKYVFETLTTYFLNDQQQAVITSIYPKRRSKAIRTFTSDMAYQGSFVGRDYKYLIQQFPLTLAEAFLLTLPLMRMGVKARRFDYVIF